ncbi:MAG: alpha-amylase family glycosyl hydrolase [Butyrivibrio sp.]|nr:alpha-amylase family glycosyl hydrolase [Butyrivibrio sp.]
MKKRLLCIIMAAVLAAVLLAGCGDSKAPNAGTSGADASQAATSGSDIAETEEGTKAPSAAPVHELNIIDDNYRNYYEIFVYSFYDSDGDEIGDLNGVTEKLDYIKDMGFNGIWLMPIMPSPTYHKYDVKDYYGIDKQYGTIDDFKKLVEECHKRDIRLVIDFVINHSSNQHEWFKQASEYLKGLESGAEPNAEECPYVNYYHFSRKQEDGTYYKINGSEWYYEGSFWSGMPDLNLADEKLRAELEDIAKYWVDMGVDGFRMDAAMHFEESDTNFNTEVLNWLYSYCKELNPDFYMVSEVWSGGSTIAAYYASKTPSMFNFDLADVEGKIIKAARGKYSAANLVKTMLSYQEDFAEKNPDYIDAPFITNHDMGRVSNALVKNEDNLKMAGGLLMMMNGSPFVYYGEEIGMSSSGSKDENKRLPMIWSAKDTEGMTKGPSAADEGIESAFAAVDEQLEDENSILNYYKRGLRLRNENPEIARGKISLVEELCVDDQAAITKEYDGSVIGILYNTSEEEAQINIGGTALEGMSLRGWLTLNNEAVDLSDGVVTMPAKSVCVLKQE